MPLWLIIGIAFEIFAIIVAIALCRAAARGAQADHEDADYSSDPYRISERMTRRARALERASITELQGHHRVGMGLDPTRRRAS
jgi:hypothetical protein